MATPSLPERAFVPFPDACPGCGYDLAGAERLPRCPECGIPIDAASPCLAIACVPKRSPGPVWRRVVWTVIILGFLLMTQGWFVVVAISPWLLLGVFLVLTASTITMLRTGTPSKRSTEVVVFTTHGFGRSAWGTKGTDEFHAWEGEYRAKGSVVSAFWQRLKILRRPTTPAAGAPPAPPDARPIFEAGLRCDQSKLDILTACIDAYARGEVPGEDQTGAFENWITTDGNPGA